MGALHEGHATLMRQARAECEKVVVSIFVNPTQFGPNEDFDRYPRTFSSDVEICRREGVDVILHPVVEEMYPSSQAASTQVVPSRPLVERLCGLFRPGHFEGVATVVMKLFGIVEPTRSYFGEKDYQQLAVISHMVADLNFPTKVVAVKTVRESDGLALSSRNVYLTADERKLAPVLQQALSAIINESIEQTAPLAAVLTKWRTELERVPGLQMQYLEACDADTLEPLTNARLPMVVLVACKLGNVRLIDNVVARK